MGRAILIVTVSVVVVVATLAITARREPPPPDGVVPVASLRPDLTGATPELKAVYDRPNQLVDGGLPAFKEQLAELRGTRIVVNKWASWCGPCRAEWPHFQRQARLRGGEIAFLGVNTLDAEKDAREFLRELPAPYPSYRDPDSEIAAFMQSTVGFPSTGFFGADGHLKYVKQGQYNSEGDLARDIDRYTRLRRPANAAGR